MILVKKDQQYMWVKDKKKQKFWRGVALISKNHPQGYPVVVVKEVKD